jgi:hypothetical protein
MIYLHEMELECMGTGEGNYLWHAYISCLQILACHLKLRNFFGLLFAFLLWMEISLL